MKKFSDISNKESAILFKGQGQGELSNDINSLDDQIDSQIDSTKLDGEWKIDTVISVSLDPPDEDFIKSNEAIVVNAELGQKPVKRGDFIYITALINKTGNYTHQNQMGVVKTRIVDIYNSLLVLNQLR